MIGSPLPVSDVGGAYNRYFGRMDTGKMKIREVMTPQGRHSGVHMHQKVFEVLAESRCLEELERVEPEALGNSLK